MLNLQALLLKSEVGLWGPWTGFDTGWQELSRNGQDTASAAWATMSLQPGKDEFVRTIHRTGPASRRSRPGRGSGAQAQLHRHRAHPARVVARRGRPRRARARVARHHGRG